MPPSAAPEWLRVGWSLETIATSAPASWASIAARMPAHPAPITSTSCFASTAGDAIRKAAGNAPLLPLFPWLRAPGVLLPGALSANRVDVGEIPPDLPEQRLDLRGPRCLLHGASLQGGAHAKLIPRSLGNSCSQC